MPMRLALGAGKEVEKTWGPAETGVNFIESEFILSQRERSRRWGYESQVSDCETLWVIIRDLDWEEI